LTKLDGTAKGGVIISIQEELGVPVRYIGVGEDIEDLQPFDASRFVSALFQN
jgi:fused signal recognition particle receptor